jgi:hypothetical protein
MASERFWMLSDGEHLPCVLPSGDTPRTLGIELTDVVRKVGTRCMYAAIELGQGNFWRFHFTRAPLLATRFTHGTRLGITVGTGLEHAYIQV